MKAKGQSSLIAAVAIAAGLSLAASLGACGAKQRPQTHKQLTERERDSILAREPLPGANVVGKALEMSDSAAARAARELPPDGQ